MSVNFEDAVKKKKAEHSTFFFFFIGCSTFVEKMSNFRLLEIESMTFWKKTKADVPNTKKILLTSFCFF
jgi:hypothetical protein